MPTVRSIPEPSISEATTDPTAFVFVHDYDLNRFTGYRFPPPGNENAAVYRVVKRSLSGAFMAAWEVSFPGRKLVASSGVFMAPLHDKLAVGGLNYGLLPNPRLPYLEEYAIIQDAGYVPIPIGGGGGGGGLRPLPPPGEQRYTDVPPGHTFYEHINILSAMHAVGGYSDGTFRPDNTLTRGQVAKIVIGALRYIMGG